VANKTEIIKKIKQREWYHVIEIEPGIKTPGKYDPKTILDIMGFPKDFSGKTVLDIGSYDGFFSFEAERRGAKCVLATDRHPPEHCGFSTARDLIGSNVEYEITSVYDLSPEKFGTFDVVLFLGVLYHLRHPILALDKIHSVCNEFAFIETHVLDNDFVYENDHYKLQDINPLLKDSPIIQFYPKDDLNKDLSNWIAPNVACLEMMIKTSGFRPELSGQWADRAAFIAHREKFTQPFWY
jgi:tRNA (mo5U34)-methyltransferase